MKTQSQWLQMLSKCGTGHPAACCCDRCKKGVETFLLESDIADIQRDAREGMVPADDLRSLVEAIRSVSTGDNQVVNDDTEALNWITKRIDALRAKHPNLFTK